MLQSRSLSQTIIVLTFGLFACQADNPTAPGTDDLSLGRSGGGYDHDRDRDRKKRCYDDYGHDGHGEYEGAQWTQGGKKHDGGRDKHCKPKKKRTGVLTIIKNADAPGTFEFSIDPILEGFTLETDESGTAQMTFEDVWTLPDYNILEVPNPEFTFIGATCTLENGEETGYVTDNGVTDVRIEHGKETVCVFTNEKIVTAVGALHVFKTSDEPATFNFEGTPSIGPFSLTTVDATPVGQLFDGLDASATYTITEILGTGFTFSDALCKLADGSVTGTLDGTSVSGIVVEDGQTTTCSFVNAAVQPEVGALNVVKTSDVAGAFDFTGSDPIGAFTLDTGDPATSAQLFENLDVAATYDVTETLNPEFDLASAACTLEDGTPTGTASGTGVTGIAIVAGQTTTCAFDNVMIQPQLGSLNVIKVSDVAGAFVFTGTDPIGAFTLDTGDPATSSQLFENLDAAITYDITETLNPAFDLVGVACTLEDGTATGTANATGVTGVAIVDGQTTTCTFENAEIQPATGSLRIVKQSDEPGVFAFDASPTIGPFTLATDDPAFSEITFGDLAIDVNYAITETPTTNFELTSVACVLDDGTATGVTDATGVTEVEIQEGLTTTCTFVNTFVVPTGFLRVVMETDAPGTFNFDGTPTIGAFTLNTAEPATSELTFELTDFAVTYTLTQTENPAFDFTSAVCTLETGEETGTVVTFIVSEIQVVLGQTTTCTFVNTTRPVGPSGLSRMDRIN